MIFGVITAIGVIISGLVTYYDSSPVKPEPNPTVTAPATSAPPWTALNLGRCGDWKFRVRVNQRLYVDEPFSIALLWQRARRGDADAGCEFNASLTFVARSKVKTSPPAKIDGLPLNANSSTFEWTGQASALGPLSVTALLAGSDLSAPVSVTATADVGPSQRVTDGDQWLAGLTESLNFEVLPKGDLTKGRKATLVGRITSAQNSPMRPRPPSLADTGEAEVCLEATGGAESERTCFVHKVLYTEPLTIERVLTMNVTNTGAITVTATVKVSGMVDGKGVGGYSSTRTEKVGSDPTVALWDVTKSAALASKEVILTVAAFLAALGAIGFVWRRRRKKDDEDDAAGTPKNAASHVGYI